jgi:hypothetical protein
MASDDRPSNCRLIASVTADCAPHQVRVAQKETINAAGERNVMIEGTPQQVALAQQLIMERARDIEAENQTRTSQSTTSSGRAPATAPSSYGAPPSLASSFVQPWTSGQPSSGYTYQPAQPSAYSTYYSSQPEPAAAPPQSMPSHTPAPAGYQVTKPRAGGY